MGHLSSRATLASPLFLFLWLSSSCSGAQEQASSPTRMKYYVVACGSIIGITTAAYWYGKYSGRSNRINNEACSISRFAREAAQHQQQQAQESAQQLRDRYQELQSQYIQNLEHMRSLTIRYEDLEGRYQQLRESVYRYEYDHGPLQPVPPSQNFAPSFLQRIRGPGRPPSYQ